MLRKLLKYDLRYLFKYWSIAAGASVALTGLAVACCWILDQNISRYAIFETAAVLGLILTVVGMCAFVVFGGVVSYVRYYKHFFTDQGYLTFTLPVSRNQLLLSKLIANVVMSGSTIIVFLLDLFMFVTCLSAMDGDPVFFVRSAFWADVSRIFDVITNTLGGYFYLYIIQILLLVLGYGLFLSLFIFACITVSSVIAKNHKALIAIAFYYFGGGAVSFGMQMLIFCLFYGFGDWLFGLAQSQIFGVIAWALGVGVLFLAMLTVGLYLLVHWMLDRKLNLS